jgi:TRAP-type C4-dicarboxylate transport system permease small subunit
MVEVISKRISRAAEFIAAIALVAIFIIFILQIFTRYAAKIAWIMPVPVLADWMANLEPIGWTVNLISLMWVWLIFFGCAFFVRDHEHVAFDIFFQAASPGRRRVMALLSAALIIGTMVYSFGPTWDAIFASRLMELKKIQTLRIPFTGDKIAIKWLFASYILLMIAASMRYIWRIYTLIRSGLIKKEDQARAPSNLPDVGNS